MSASPADDVPAVELREATAVRGRRTVWSESNLTIPQGTVVGVIGPNGAGKTTLFQVLLGLLPLASGEVRVLGGSPSRGDRRIGYVPQNYTSAVGDAVRCRDLVALGISGTRFGLGRLSAAEAERVEAVLADVGADGFAHRRMSELSGGQQQRVAIAQALVDRPRLLLLDEPLANLDVRNQHEIVTLLDELQGEHPITVLVVAHDLNPLLSVLGGAVYLLDGHAHYNDIGHVVDGDLLTHLYGTRVRVVRTAQGDLFTRSG